MAAAAASTSFESPLHYAEPEKRHIELWDPDTGQWTLGPAQTEARAYHSTALLLPDGRVMSAGDDYNGDPGQGQRGGRQRPDGGHGGDLQAAVPVPRRAAGDHLGRHQHRARPIPPRALPIIGFNGSFGVNTPNTNITGAALAAPAA